MLRIDYRETGYLAVLSWDASDDGTPWMMALRIELNSASGNTSRESGFSIVLPWWAFVGVRLACREIFRAYDLNPERDFLVTPAARELLQRASQNAISYHSAIDSEPVAIDVLLAKLAIRGFERKMTEPQKVNVAKLAALPAGATFSVPGAGKTTEALAIFFFRAQEGDRLLVIAPKNAFAAWDEQLAICAPSQVGRGFVRLRGRQIEGDLQSDPRFLVIGYQQFNNSRELIARHISRHRTFVFLDESHRIKGGMNRQSASAILETSFLPVGKLVMSGTPMPQSVEDLIPQFQFLYPELRPNVSTVVDLLQPIYVRTKKQQLNIPEPNRVVKMMQMRPVQTELYRLMRSELARQAHLALSDHSRVAFRSLGRSVARLLQFVSNPPLLSTQIGFAHDDLLRGVLAEGDGPKLAYVLRRARELVRQGHKVLIWSSFVANVDYVASRLADLGAVYIHGSVDAGSDEDLETREGKIKAFHDRNDVMVLVANPAAASEGISLHKVCYHAIYLDRTFNAAHYIQSEDRIHRLGQQEVAQIEIVECESTVDEQVRWRLEQKIVAMGRVFDDSSLLSNQGLTMEPTDDSDEETFNVGLELSDIEILAHDPVNDE
jgi:hypothetical protein